MLLQFKLGPELLFSVFADSAPRVGETITHSLDRNADRALFNQEYLELCDTLRGKHWRVLHVDYEYIAKSVGSESRIARLFVEPARDPYTDDAYLIARIQEISRNVLPHLVARSTTPMNIRCLIVADTDDKVEELRSLLIEAGITSNVDTYCVGKDDYRLLRGRTRYFVLADRASWGTDEELHACIERSLFSAKLFSKTEESLILFR